MIVDAEEYPATCSSEPRVLVADACSVGPGNDSAIILRCTVATSCDHGCLALVSRGEAFPNASICSSSSGSSPQKTTPRCFRSLAVKLPLLCPNTATKELTEIISLVGRNLSTVHHFGGGQLVDASSALNASHVVTSVSHFFPFGKPQSLPGLVDRSAVSSGDAVKSVGACQCQPISCVQ